jgi:hypothetical protein
MRRTSTTPNYPVLLLFPDDAAVQRRMSGDDGRTRMHRKVVVYGLTQRVIAVATLETDCPE